MTNPAAPTGAATAVPVAAPSRRALAYLVDAGIGAVIGGVGYGITLASVLGATDLTALLATMSLGLGIVGLALLAWFLVCTALQGSSGGSVGMRLLGLRLVREEAPAEPLGFGRALVRNLLFAVTAAIVVGYFTPLFDGSGRFQGWHDRAGRALMLDVRSLRSPAVAAATPAAGEAASVVPAEAPGTETVAIPGLPPVPPRPPLPVPAEDPEFPDETVVSGPAVAAAAESPAPVPPAPVPPVPDDAGRVAAAAPAPAEADVMITTVPGISPAVAPRPEPPVTGPEATPDPGPVVPPVPPADDAPSEEAPPSPAPQIPGEEDDLEDTRLSVPGHRLVFVWDDGTRSLVSGRTVFGRNPAEDDGATLVAVRDETLSLSKTHFEAAAEAVGGWVLDRHSTNGLTIVRDGVRIACPPGERVRIRLGDAIQIGERIVTVGGYA
ncbi:RDD family protein [Streptomyces sp. MS2A]|nr:RDD family protein [Streptomyces sp. MS2A]